MHRADQERGVDPLSPSPVIVSGPAPAPPTAFRPPAPPWSEHYRPEVVIEEDTTREPAKPRPKPKRTPNIDAVREWQGQQLIADGTRT
jgi:hypothetical protein